MIFLAADIGGSRARLLLGETRPGGWRELRRVVWNSPDFPDLESLLAAFLAPGEQPAAACLALAGPVQGRQVPMTNLPWVLDADALEARFQLRELCCINDFEAQAHGLPLLAKADLRTLQPGQPDPRGPRLLIGAGTGLGMALLAGPEHAPLILPSEAGHMDFAPRDEQQLALLRHLQPRHGRVTLELLLSGHGLERLYGFLAGLPAGTLPAPRAAPSISAAALAGEPQAAAAVDLFARLLAAAAGNLALTSLPRGGVYLSGGIAPRILPFLLQPAVRAAFTDKPPMRPLLEQLPLQVVLNEYLGLLGAASVAARLAGEARP